VGLFETTLNIRIMLILRGTVTHALSITSGFLVATLNSLCYGGIQYAENLRVV